MNHPEDLKYAKTHEWVRLEDGIVITGITDHAQDAMGDLVYIEAPAVGSNIIMGDAVGVVESVKTASDIYAPITGTVIEVNELLADDPEHVNTSPYNSGWIYKIKPADLSELDELLSASDYEHSID